MFSFQSDVAQSSVIGRVDGGLTVMFGSISSKYCKLNQIRATLNLHVNKEVHNRGDR